MRVTFTVVAVLALTLSLFMPAPVGGTGSMLDEARAAYPSIVGTMLDSCDLCHSSIPDLNSYGAEYMSNGFSLSAIEDRDADGDGHTNLAEILAGTWPGDASSFPAGGGVEVPGVPGNLTATVNGTSAELAWSAPTDGDAATAYQVMVGTTAGGSDVLDVETTNMTRTLNNLAVGTYHARVLGRNEAGDGAATDDTTFEIVDGGDTPVERVVARGLLGDQTDVTALDIARPFKGDQAPAGYLQGTVATGLGRFASSRLAGTVSLLGTDPDGDTTTPRQISTDVDAEGNVAVTAHKKGEALAWQADSATAARLGVDGMTLVQWTKRLKPKKKPVELAGTAGDTALASNPDARGKTYYNASGGTEGGAELNLLKKNKLQKRTAIATRATIPEIDSVLGFANGEPDGGVVLLGGETGTGGTRLLGLLVEKGAVTSISDPLTDFVEDLEADAAFGDTAPGIAAYRDGSKVFTAGLNADGTLADDWSRLSGASASGIAVEAQSDGSFLVVWIDGGTLMAVDVDLAAGTTSDAFELQDATEVVQAGLVSAARVGDSVIVLYATTDGLRTAVVGAPS